MKNISFIFMLATFLTSMQLKSQSNETSYPKTLFNSENTTYGGYGAFTTKATLIDNANSLLVGGRGGMIANHKFSVGLSGYYMVSDRFKNASLDVNSFYSGGYGGIFGEVILFPKNLLNVSIPVEIGAGYLAQIDKDISSKGSTFAYFQPGVEVDLNIAKGFKFGLGVSYSFSQSLNSINALEFKPLDGPSLALNFKWGIF